MNAVLGLLIYVAATAVMGVITYLMIKAANNNLENGPLFTSAFVLLVLTVVAVIALPVSLCSSRGKDEKTLKEYKRMNRQLKMIDSVDSAKASDMIRVVSADEIDDINERLRMGRRFNAGLLDLWARDEFDMLDELK